MKNDSEAEIQEKLLFFQNWPENTVFYHFQHSSASRTMKNDSEAEIQEKLLFMNLRENANFHNFHNFQIAESREP